MTREQNIETLTANYAAYLAKMQSEDIADLEHAGEYVRNGDVPSLVEAKKELDASEKAVQALIKERDEARRDEIDFVKIEARLYCHSPFDLGTDKDNVYRDGVDKTLEAIKERGVKMNKYQRELQQLKPYDEVQGMNQYGALKGYNKIYTSGHGYLVVTRTDKNFTTAKTICKYGFIGYHAVYLEEDCELPAFLNKIS